MAEKEIREMIDTNHKSYERSEYNYKTYLKTLLDIINDKQYDYDSNKRIYNSALEEAIELGPEKKEQYSKENNIKILLLFMIDNDIKPPALDNIIKYNYGEDNDGEDNYGEDILFIYERDKIKTSLKVLRTYPYYNRLREILEQNKELFNGGSRRNKPKPKAKPKHDDMTMKDIKEMCKANQIKLSKVVEGKRVVFNKKELITKLKRKKLL
jgi:hypothetical protein